MMYLEFRISLFYWHNQMSRVQASLWIIGTVWLGAHTTIQVCCILPRRRQETTSISYISIDF